MRGCGLPWPTNERLRSPLTNERLRSAVAGQWEAKFCPGWPMRYRVLPCLTNERLPSALADKWETKISTVWPMRGWGRLRLTNERLDRLSLAGAEGSACEGKRFHGVPDLVEEFCHRRHAREMTPKKWHHLSFIREFENCKKLICDKNYLLIQIIQRKSLPYMNVVCKAYSPSM